jgi:ATP-dependent protease ClpP protease subunit
MYRAGASMGAFLLSSGTKGKRFALANSEIMIHSLRAAFKVRLPK